jgi:hypothetical protein
MDIRKAKTIITYVVNTTKIRWQQYDEKWEEIDSVFLSRGYEQGGFEAWKFAEYLKKENIFSIEKLGLILDNYKGDIKYVRIFAGSFISPFYQDLKNGLYGDIGKKFYKCVNNFHGRAGAWFWSKLWQMLVCCNHLKNDYNGSFSYFLRKKFAEFNKVTTIHDSDFLSLDEKLWKEFKKVKKPWKELYGIGENVFDFIIGDIVEAKFVKNSYKLDSANLYFLKVTGIDKLLNSNLNRENVINFLLWLNIPYPLREINKGIYTYCSETESGNFGFCRSKQKCSYCGINNICEKNLD